MRRCADLLAQVRRSAWRKRPKAAFDGRRWLRLVSVRGRTFGLGKNSAAQLMQTDHTLPLDGRAFVPQPIQSLMIAHNFAK